MKNIQKIRIKNKKQYNQKWQITAFIFICAFTMDQISKYFVKVTMEVGQTISIIGNFFKIRYILNDGVAFGSFQGNIIVTFVFPIIMVIVFLVLMKHYHTNHFYLYALTFMLAGTLGNLSDRIFNNSYVVDFISFNFFGYEYPAFNFADIFLVSSIFALIIEGFIFDNRKKRNKNAKK